MHPVHVEPIDWFSSRWLVPGIERPNLGGLKSGKHLPGGEVVSESMLLIFADSIQVFRGESDLRMDLIEVLGGISLSPAIGQTALKILGQEDWCRRWLGWLTFE